VFDRAREKIKGVRTFLGAGAFVAVGALGVLGEFDLTPVVQMFVKNPDSLPLAMLGIGVFFGMLRYITTTPVGGYQSPYQSAPTFKGVDVGE
jgi:hypothetical protein